MGNGLSYQELRGAHAKQMRSFLDFLTMVHLMLVLSKDSFWKSYKWAKSISNQHIKYENVMQEEINKEIKIVTVQNNVSDPLLNLTQDFMFSPFSHI